MTTNGLGIPRKALIVGATSDVGAAVARALARQGTSTFVLAARDTDAAAPLASEFGGETVPFDATDPASVRAMLDAASEGGDVDFALLAWGVLPDQESALEDPKAVDDVFMVNASSAAAVLSGLAARMRQQGQGTIVVMSSVAVARPRRANFLYGASKSALDFFARGLSEQLRGTGVSIVIVRAGFLRSKMTAHLREPPGAGEPADVASAVIDALASRKTLVYVPPLGRPVSMVLRLLPKALVRRIPF